MSMMSQTPLSRMTRVLMASAVCFLAAASLALAEDPKPPNVKSDEVGRVSSSLLPTPVEYSGELSNAQKGDDISEKSVCGNEVIESSEQCDDGNDRAGDGCDAACQLEGEKCGNGFTDAGETCGEPGLGPCAPPDTCESCQCRFVAPVCGNGKAEQGEVCGEPGLASCAAGKQCQNCACQDFPAICGNGFAESGEECGEPGLACNPGFNCDGQTCRCVSSFCGNNAQDAGEICGEPGLPNCPDGKTCVNCQCQCTGPECFTCHHTEGFVACPNDQRCRVSYCHDLNGGCHVDNHVESASPGDLDTVQYHTGTASVPECCAQVSYRLSVGYNHCTGQIDESTYRADVLSVTPSGGAACICPILEPDGSYMQGGQIVGCEESIDASAGLTATAVAGSNPPRIRVECSDCCRPAGHPRSVEISSLPSAPSRAPVSCGSNLQCPS